MEHNPKIYAKALVSVITDKDSNKQQEKIAANFLKILEKNSDIKKAKEIISLAENFYCQKTGIRKIILETARTIGIRDFKKSFIEKGDIIQEKINPELVAGIKIIVNDEKQLDFSLKKLIDEIII